MSPRACKKSSPESEAPSPGDILSHSLFISTSQGTLVGASPICVTSSRATRSWLFTLPGAHCTFETPTLNKSHESLFWRLQGNKHHFDRHVSEVLYWCQKLHCRSHILFWFSFALEVFEPHLFCSLRKVSCSTGIYQGIFRYVLGCCVLILSRCYY